MKRSPLKRKTPLRRSKPIPKVSKKRQAENNAYARLRGDFLENHPECEVCLKEAEKRFYLGGDPVVNKATEIHHAGRRQGKWLLDTRNWLAVCRKCHTYIEEHGDWARMNGYLMTPEQRRLA